MTSSAAANNKFNWSGFSEIGTKLYLKGETADVHFLVKKDDGDVERIPAHKMLLAAGSAVFNRMIYGELKETDELKETGDVAIVDASASAFAEFLQCFYMDEVELTIANVGQVMYLSEKYHIDKCKAACVELMLRDLTEENVCQAYQLAILFNEAKLEETCTDFISRHAKDVLQSDGFLECDRVILERIVRSNSLPCPETLVFEACMAWVKRASQKDEITREIVQTHLGNLFYAIRFRSMTIAEFSSLMPSYTHLFSSDEYGEIIQMMTNEQFQPQVFNGMRREFQWNMEGIILCNRFDSSMKTRYYINYVETTTFTTNKPLFLGGFKCEASNIDLIRCAIKVKIQRKENPQPIMLYQGDREMISINRLCIMLLKPVLIRPGIDHEIQLKMDIPSGTLSTPFVLKPEVQIKSNVIVRFSNDPVQDGHTTGYITTLLFKA